MKAELHTSCKYGKYGIFSTICAKIQHSLQILIFIFNICVFYFNYQMIIMQNPISSFMLSSYIPSKMVKQS